MNIAFGETYTIEAFRLKENSEYEYEKEPYITFKGRPASTLEAKNYRIQSGVDGSTDSVYVVATNLPPEIKTGDKVRFMSKSWTIANTGYYFDQARIINASVLSDEQIVARCPKGLSLQ